MNCEERRKKLEVALRHLLIAELGDKHPPYLKEQVEDAVEKFFEGKLKIWYSNDWLTFTESTGRAFEK